MRHPVFTACCLIPWYAFAAHSQSSNSESYPNVRILLRERPMMRSPRSRQPHDPYPTSPTAPKPKRLSYAAGLHLDHDTFLQNEQQLPTDLIIEAERVYVPKGVTLGLRGYGRIFINSRRSVIDGTIDARGGQGATGGAGGSNSLIVPEVIGGNGGAGGVGSSGTGAGGGGGESG